MHSETEQMKTNLIFLIGICFCLITCKKDVPIPASQNTPVSSIPTSKDTLVFPVPPNQDTLFFISDTIFFGADSNMMLTQYNNRVVEGGLFNGVAYMNLDINKDNTPDFTLKNETWGSPAAGYHRRSTIFCSNSNSLIAGILKNDTSYLNKSITIYQGADSTVQIYNSDNTSCRRIAPNDSIMRISLGQFKIVPKAQGELLSKLDFFQSGTCIFIGDKYSFPSVVKEIRNDTTIYQTASVDDTCDSYPIEEIKYIGIKIKDAHSERLGWIKLSIGYHGEIKIFESAIQK
jgi:hypothetical protein